MHMYEIFLSCPYDRKLTNISTAIKDNYCNNLIGLHFSFATSIKCADTCTLSVPIFIPYRTSKPLISSLCPWRT